MAKLKASELNQYIDFSLTPPSPFRGQGPIRLIVLGQDPTVQKPDYRKKIKVTLLLNQPGWLRTYLNKVCQRLGIDLDENIYATNLLKNFFSIPPDKMRKKDPSFFQKAAEHWIPLLKKEIAEFKNVPILPLGEPVLNCLTKSPARTLIRHYWGYEGPARYGQNFAFIPPSENILSRIIFPFPHIPGLAHKFYRQQMDGYLAFMKEFINP
jgi:hypothetical protein